jgi:hypothetical protein
VRANTYSGRPLGSEEFVKTLERDLGRVLDPKKGGRPRKEIAEVQQQCLWFDAASGGK